MTLTWMHVALTALNVLQTIALAAIAAWARRTANGAAAHRRQLLRSRRRD